MVSFLKIHSAQLSFEWTCSSTFQLVPSISNVCQTSKKKKKSFNSTIRLEGCTLEFIARHASDTEDHYGHNASLIFFRLLRIAIAVHFTQIIQIILLVCPMGVSLFSPPVSFWLFFLHFLVFLFVQPAKSKAL